MLSTARKLIKVSTQPAIANVTNTITSTPDIVYGLATLNANK